MTISLALVPDPDTRRVLLDKIKRPGGVFSYDAQHLAEDEHGHWLFLGEGSEWRAAHDEGQLSVDVVILIRADRPWVGWWVDDPADRRVEFDVCLPPGEPERDRWAYVDLELDPVLHVRSELVEVQDWEEFQESVAAGVIDQRSASLAIETAETRLFPAAVGVIG